MSTPSNDEPARLLRSPDAVRVLEDLQRAEHKLVGDVEPTDDHSASLRDALQMERIGDALDAGGLEAVIAAVGPEEDAAIDARVAQLEQQWQLDNPEQWSRFERPDLKVRIAELTARLDTAVQIKGDVLERPPVVGTFPTGEVSAFIQPTEGGAVVLIDSGFFRFSSTLAQLAIQASFDSTLAQPSEATLQLCSDLLSTQLAMGTCLYLYPRQVAPQIAGAVDAFDEGINLFVLAHEYAHILEGHVDPHPMGIAEVAVPDDLEHMELTADTSGIQIAMLGQRGRPQTPHYAVAGALVYLAGLDLLNEADQVYSGRPADAERGGYPSPRLRLATMRQAFETSGLWDELGDVVEMGLAMHGVLLDLWGLIEEPFREVSPTLREIAASEGTLIEYVNHSVVAAAWEAVRSANR